ncbi:MAG: hypothetical protein GF309_10345 [Candidatus Lokiarchaeota archaeon]|nr:hypothetical protein [Candidatus Lokiarchaeota archaeon]
MAVGAGNPSPEYTYQVTALASNGTHLWNRSIDGTRTDDWDYGWGIDVDENDNFYTIGQYNGSRGLLIKWDKNGTQIWNRTWVTAGYDVKIGMEGWIYTVGSTGSGPDFAVARWDPDDDGLINLYECRNGTLPFNWDSDSDLIPEGWEIGNSTDPLNGTDAYDDDDEDMLSNLYEYRNGTLPHDADTDDDMMPDGWEVKYGLDPLRYNPDENPDGDGLQNFDEYVNGADPFSNDTDQDTILDGLEVL